MSPLENVNEIFNLYKNYGEDDYIGEPVSQIEHMCQAADFAKEEGYDEEVILAAFSHDIGHFCFRESSDSMDGYGTIKHEKIGADYLRTKGFSERIAKLVENHVSAKRYLTFKNPNYFSKLSEASKKTLEFQGGIMTKEEAEKFENDDLFELSIKMRMWDEAAKEINKPLPDIELFKKIAFKILSK